MTMKMKRFYSLPPSLIFISPLIQVLVTVEVKEVGDVADVEEDCDRCWEVLVLVIRDKSFCIVLQRTFWRLELSQLMTQ